MLLKRDDLSKKALTNTLIKWDFIHLIFLWTNNKTDCWKPIALLSLLNELSMAGLTRCWQVKGLASSQETPCAALIASSCQSFSTSELQVVIIHDLVTVMIRFSQEHSSATSRYQLVWSTCGPTSERCTSWTLFFSPTRRIRLDHGCVSSKVISVFQDIVNIYKDQLGIKTVKHEELASPKYTTSVPSTLAAWISSQKHFYINNDCQLSVQFNILNTLIFCTNYSLCTVYFLFNKLYMETTYL